MRILKITNATIAFNGVRQDRNTVSQLKQDNPYDLNVPNQRRINTAIEELSKQTGEDNVNFLLDVSENLKYGTNIDLGKKPYNDWRAKLNKAAEKSLKNSDKSVQEKLAKRLDSVLHAKKEYTKEEKAILAQRELLFEKIDRKALSEINNSNTRNFNRNLNYFIISSEVPTSQKLYILKRLNYLMSDEYKINPQLADKKTQVAAEIVNDIVVNTPESKVPNIKAINQKQHGMCGAISVSRKALAYEDKVNYVDMILSELDDTPMIQVYDRTKLGTKAKIPVPKAQIDYNYALSKGYRIVDTAVMNWMNVGDTVGAFNEVVGAYTPFDKENFETFADSHILKDIDEQTVPKQDFYRSLAKAKDVIGKYKKDVEKRKYLTSIKSSTLTKNVQSEKEDFDGIRNIIRNTLPKANEQELRYFINNIVKLNVTNTDEKNKLPENLRKYAYVTNEPVQTKVKKITEYLTDCSNQPVNNTEINRKSEDLAEYLADIQSKKHYGTTTPAQNYRHIQKLYEAAAAYRTQQVFQLDIPEYLQALMEQYNVPDEETLIINNLKDLSEKLRTNRINPTLKQKLFENFTSEINQIKETQEFPAADEEILADVLDEYAVTVNTLRTTIADDLYSSLLLGSRRNNLANQLNALQLSLLNNNKDFTKEVALDFGIKNNKAVVLEHLGKLISVLKGENCTEEQYNEIFNKSGHKSELRNLYNAFGVAHSMLFEDGNQNYIRGFNVINGAPADSPIETTEDMYKVLAKSFDNMSFIIKTLQNNLQIQDDNGEILNTADPKFIVLKKMENKGELPTKKELESFRQKFNQYSKLRYDDEYNRVKFSQLPKEITTFTNFEKEAIKKYSKNINSWYYTVNCRLTDSYRDLKAPLEELNRDIGVKAGEYWVKEGDSGLSSVNSAKILEHMTGRPYYVESDGQKGIEKAKNSPYSLNSSTHVMHTEVAPHAQYVVDIKPVEIKKGDKTETKDIILHDNTWGAAEHENIWIDENGFTRTDYLSGYGGEKGFITDDEYRNGNIAENLLEKYGHYVPEDIPTKSFKKLNKEHDEEFKFSLFNRFIVQGYDPGAQSTVSNIKLKLLMPSDELIDDLTDYAKDMTREEIKSAMLRISTAGETSRAQYKKMLDEIKGTDEIIDKGITSKEDYDKLSENNPLKIALEKAALYTSYNKIPDYKKFAAETKTMADINKLKKEIRTDARKNFDYILGNHPDFVRYCAEASRKEINSLLQDFSNKHNLNLKTNDIIDIVNDMKKVRKEDFDGEIDNSINIAVNNFKKSLNKHLKNNLPNQDEQINDLARQVYKIIKNKTIISKNDINALNNSAPNFVQWLDREFSPKSDDEFAQILTNLRKMPTAEFNKKYSDTISNQDLGIKEVSGYDIAKMIRNENSAARRTFVNTVFMQEYYKDVNLAKTTPYYELTKFGRRHSGDSYINHKRTFDDIYIDYYYNLEMFNLGKMFAKHKDEGYRKFGVFPAYPQIKISTEANMNNILEDIYGKINSYMGAVAAYDIQMKNIRTLNKLNKYMNEYLPQDGELSKYQYKKVVKALKGIFSERTTEPIYQEACDKFYNLLQSGSKSIPEFREVINFAYDRYDTYSVTLDGKSIQEAKEARLADIDAIKASYIRTIFEPKYQGKAFELLNKWVSAKSKAAANNSDQDFMEADKIYDKFKEFFVKHRLIQTPEKYLHEYLMLCAKDTTPKTLNIPEPESKDAQGEFEALRENYKESLESLLGKADMLEMQEILMNCAEKGNLNSVRNTFKNSTLALKDGSVVPLDSNEALAPLLAPMLSESNLDTAALFINQLGLSENIVRALVKNPPYDEAYKNAARIQSMLRSVDSQAKFIKEELKALGKLDNDPNYKEKIEKFKQDIINKAQRTNYRRTVKTYEAAFNEAFELFDKFPRMSKDFILNASMDAALQEIRGSLAHNLDVLNQPMKILQTKTRLLEKLVVPDNTDVIDIVKEYFDKYQQLVEYIDNTTGEFPNIGMHTEE